MGEKNILYLCNGEVKECKKTNCYKRGGPCRHTSNVRYAENFQKYGEVREDNADRCNAESNNKTGSS